MELRPAPPQVEARLGLAPALPQSDLWAGALGRLGLPAQRLMICDGGEAVALCARLLRARRLALTARGPVWIGSPPAARRGAALRCLTRGLLTLLDAETDADARTLRGMAALRLFTPAHVAELDLTPPLATLRARLDQKWRNRLCRAEETRAEITATTLPADPGHWLLRAEAAQRRRLGYRALPARATAALAAAGPEATLLIRAGPASDPQAAMLFLRHGRAASYHIGWRAPGQGGELHRALLWQAIVRLADTGIERLDLGTLDTRAAPGLARFKIGTGARVRPLGGSWIIAPFAPPRWPRPAFTAQAGARRDA